MEQLKTWIMGLAGAALLCAIASELTPEGKTKSVQRLLCGIVMTLAFLSPIAEADFGSYAVEMAKYRIYGEELTARAGDVSNALSRTFIEEETEAYILDKAKELGCTLAGAKAELRWSSEGCWYPVSAELDGDYNKALSELLETELGIVRRQQKWRGDENT